LLQKLRGRLLNHLAVFGLDVPHVGMIALSYAVREIAEMVFYATAADGAVEGSSLLVAGVVIWVSASLSTVGVSGCSSNSI